MYSTSAILVAVSALGLLQGIQAQAVPASASEKDLLVVDQEYINSGFPGTDPTTGFGVPLDAQALLTVIYDGIVVQPGQALTQAQVGAIPSIYVTPSTDHTSNFTSTDAFTLTLADASALGHPDPQGNFRHYLANGVHGGSGTGDNATFALVRTGANVITSYAGPGPAAGEGPHRYAWLLFQQPTTFTPPANLSAASTAPSHWSVQSYVSSSHLGSLVAATFFTVENGAASYSVAPTSTVDPATITVPTTAAGATTAGQTTGAGGSTTTSGGAPAATTSAGGSGAAGVRVVKGLVGVVLGAGVAAFFF